MAQKPTVTLEPWKCAGCGEPSPDQLRNCDCPTVVLFREEGERLVTEVKRDPMAVPVDDKLVRAATAILRTTRPLTPEFREQVASMLDELSERAREITG